MKAETLSFYHLPDLSIIGLLIFFSFFTAMLIWVFSSYRRPVYLRVQELPLGED